MLTDSKSHLSRLFQLRQELSLAINRIIGYSDMIIAAIAENKHQDVTYLQELEQIRASGRELLTSVNIVLDPAILTGDWQSLQAMINNPQLKSQWEKTTQLVIARCQQLIPQVDQNFMLEIEQINRAANLLLQEISGLIEVVASEEFFEDIVLDIDTNPLLDNFSLADHQLAKASKGQMILVVDDSAMNREILAQQVQAEGYQAATAQDGKQAIEMIQTGAFDLILLDIIMPEIDGYQVLKWIRNSPWKHIPTIMISALEQIDSVVKCIEMGAEDYLTKPFNSILLKARLGACLEQKKWRDLESIYVQQLAQANQKISQFNNCLQVENTRLSSELEVNQKLQKMLLPKEKELQQIEALEIAGFSEAAAEIGGDYYDVVQHQGRIIIGIGDVSGHGLESGVLMLMVQTAIRTLIENNETDPKRLFEVLNRTIYKNVQRLNSDKNISLSLVDYYEGVLSISGQHEEILLSRQGKIERIDTVDLGFPLGLAESIADFVFETKIPLGKSDVAILYTDGITEAENSQGIHYGLEQLSAVVQQNWQQSAQDIRQAVIQDLRSHIGIEQVYDDITLVVLKRK
ncbi:response regulator receiver protein [Pleurocapsa sp. CCALA 161]|uniref:SpoIIE family protein phosphatase n=1 Tax=Pleurocapsa sp. CCALA 161 TaxID=2107688 RepID=UPI000D0658CD|nr:SpoIIE family protein phosphatase [Pleurocapsa sp. CCALA 161]PSB12394.1 response regulator receiver protein [Pleurocapsa sp. CCALA 161]